MRAILELEIDSKEEKLLFNFLQATKISFKSTHLQEKEVAFEKGANASETLLSEL